MPLLPKSIFPISLITASMRDELMLAYAAPDRHYHDLRHIEALLGLMRQHLGDLADPATVEAAIWFHDAVYDTRQSDNEHRSSLLAVARLSDAGSASVKQITRVMTMIGATADHVVPDIELRI